MEKKNYNVIGVMSGTSLDGIDVAFVKITSAENLNSPISQSYSAHIHEAETIPYTPYWVAVLKEAVNYSTEKLAELNVKYTEYLSQVITSFIRKHKLTAIDALCSHGHTVLHSPADGVTLQIGNLPSIASLTGHKVVCDFRVQDVKLGGQGAPLVPIGDTLLFGDYDYCLNLGGFANVSRTQDRTRVAYDICAVNTVLNVYAQKLGMEYDAGGAFAKAGTTNYILLKQLNILPFYRQDSPKSLGIEWVHKNIFPLIDGFKMKPVDVLATFTEHVAMQLASQFTSESKVLVTGGGAYNTYLMELLGIKRDAHFLLPDPRIIEYKEALIFALLGVLKLENKVNTLSSVTGASYDHSAGEIYLP